jgi:DNA-directed RNA polymerase III subunit RPC7
LEHSRLFQQEVRDGPFYAFLDSHSRMPKPGELSGSGMLESSANREAIVGNPFESMRTYSQKFVKPKKTMPRLDQRQYGTHRLILFSYSTDHRGLN